MQVFVQGQTSCDDENSRWWENAIVVIATGQSVCFLIPLSSSTVQLTARTSLPLLSPPLTQLHNNQLHLQNTQATMSANEQPDRINSVRLIYSTNGLCPSADPGTLSSGRL